MDRVTESLLNEFSAEHELTHLIESKRFEHFACYSVVKREHSETFSTSDLVVGDDKESKKGADTGIDAIAIIVNGSLITDIEELDEQVSSAGYLEVSFIFVQAETSASFDSSKIGTFGYGVEDFFRESPNLPRNEKVSTAAEIARDIYDKRSSKFKRGNPTCKLFYVTTGRWTGEQHPTARMETVKSDLLATGLFKDVDCVPIGAELIQDWYRRTKHSVSTTFNFLSRVTVKPQIPNVQQAYFGFLPWSEFQKLIIDESGNLIRGLFFDNVRDWQGYNDVNLEIKNTIDSDKKGRFVLMNNGITIIARSLTPVADIFHIEDYQIVNGCQTSHVLFENRGLLDDSVSIPIRLISTKDEDVTNAIIKATNWQRCERNNFLRSKNFLNP
jgi:hypothetical protein